MLRSGSGSIPQQKSNNNKTENITSSTDSSTSIKVFV